MRFIAPLSAAVLALCAIPALAHQEKLQGSEWAVIGDPADATILQQAKIYRKQIELMISIPDYKAEEKIYLDNNWQIEFKK